MICVVTQGTERIIIVSASDTHYYRRKEMTWTEATD
mgnify:CR=1 FL=1